MRRVSLILGLTVLCLPALASSSLAKKAPPGPGYTLVGSATLVSPGNGSATAVQVSSPGPSDPWGAIGFAVAPGLKLAQIKTLASDYELLVGGCQAGAPRFTVGVAKGPTTYETWFYFGRQPDGSIACPSGAYTNTGNLASPTSLVDTSQLPGGSYSQPYSDVQARYGSYVVKYIAIDVDGGSAGDQTVDLDNTQVNNALYTYEP